jgi:hypothetical protein
MAPPTMMIVSSFREWCSWPFLSCLAAQIHKQLTRGFLVGRKMHKESIWKDKNCNEFSGFFREGMRHEIFWVVRKVFGLGTWDHELAIEWEAYLKKTDAGGHEKRPGRLDQADRPGDPATPFASVFPWNAPCSLIALCSHAPQESAVQTFSATPSFLNDEINASLLYFVSHLVFHGSCVFTYFLQNKVMLPSPMLVLYMCPRCFDDKASPWCIIEHKVLNKPQNPPLIMFSC